MTNMQGLETDDTKRKKNEDQDISNSLIQMYWIWHSYLISNSIGLSMSEFIHATQQKEKKENGRSFNMYIV